MVSIDTVYQKVLALANKEQRGYITPQEFNLFANQAQMDIFEQYFYDLNQLSRLPGNDTEYSDMLNYLEQKINVFETSKDISINNAQEFYNAGAQISNLYRIGSVSYLYNDIVQTAYGGSTSVSGQKMVTCEQVNAKDIVTINKIIEKNQEILRSGKKIIELVSDSNELDIDYYREATQISLLLNIPRCTIYNIINKGDTLNHKVKKYDNMFITRITDKSKPVFQRVLLEY